MPTERVDATPPSAAPGSAAAEWAVAAGLFVFAVAAFWVRSSASSDWQGLAALVFFCALSAAMLSLSVSRWRERLRGLHASFVVRAVAAPIVMTCAIAIYSKVVGLAVAPRVAAFGAYLLLPAILVATGGRDAPSPARVLVAAAALWLPIEFDLLPALRLPPPDGFRAVALVGLTSGLFLFLVACPFSQIGYRFLLRPRDLGMALLAALVFAVAAVPIGLGTGFLEWHPRAELGAIAAAPLAIYLATAIPEEFLFRGLIQNALERLIGRAGFPLAAIVFGFAHLPDLRYVLLATLAGLAYGWVYARTRRITASAVTHTTVNWIWLVLLRA